MAALLRLDQDAEIVPTWESHLPGDFWGLERAGEWVGAGADQHWETRPGYVLICEPEGGEPIWTIPEDPQ